VAASVRIESKAFEDPRFGILARLLGFADGHHALIKVARVWQWQAEEYAPDSPTYVVPNDILEHYLGPGSGEALVKSRLAYCEPIGSGGDVGYRMRGSTGRIEWLYAKRQNGKKGGRPCKSEPVGFGLGSQLGDLYQTDIEPASNPPSPSPSPSPVQERESSQSGRPDAPALSLVPLPVVPKPDPVAAAAELAIAELNHLTGKHFAPDSKPVIANVRALLKAKHTADDMLRVIRFKVARWNGRAEMRENLVPTTLLRPSNFERYLVEMQGLATREAPRHDPDADFRNSPDEVA
jgi:uncharacterized phage protein (TIGR02220 family)